MAKVWEKLKGWKTYFVCAAAIVYALYGVHIGQMDWNTALEFIFGALGGAGLRHSVSTAL